MKLLHYYRITTELLHRFSTYYSNYLLYCSNCSNSILYTPIRDNSIIKGGIYREFITTYRKLIRDIELSMVFYVVNLNYYILHFSYWRGSR